MHQWTSPNTFRFRESSLKCCCLAHSCFFFSPSHAHFLSFFYCITPSSAFRSLYLSLSLSIYLSLPQGGASEGTFLDAKEVKALEKMPTKQELYGQIARALKNAGAQGIAVRLKQAAGGKLVKAIKLAYTDAEKRPDAPAE